MPRKKKPARELTTEEIARRLFPKKVRDEVHREAEEESEGAGKPKKIRKKAAIKRKSK